MLRRSQADSFARGHKFDLLSVALICWIGFAICMVLLFSGCASSTLGRALNVGVGVSAAADYVTTQQGLSRGATEANPLMQTSALGQALVKLGGVGAVMGAAWWLDSRQQTVWGHVVRAVFIAVNVGVSLHNAGVYR